MYEINGVNFDVEIKRKKIKNMYIRLSDKTIMVTCPRYIPEYEINRFIDARRDWIYKTYKQTELNKKISLKYLGGDYFFIFNQPYRLIRTIGKSNVYIKDDCIYLSYKDDDEKAIQYLYKYLDKMLLEKAYEYLDKHIDFLKDYGYNLYPELKCRLMKSRWGVCYTRKNSICISSYLIHYPVMCLEYIMVHEMTHFIIPNHSKRFYEVVLNNMSNYKSAEALLK